jgi:hypothetical protein
MEELLTKKDYLQNGYGVNGIGTNGYATFSGDDADDDRPLTKDEIWAGLQESFREIELHQAGKIELQDAREWVMNEL